MHTPKASAGFTLVELGIVLVIIGLISYLVYPVIIDFTKKEKESAGKSDLEALKKDIMGYAITKSGSLPNATAFTGLTDPWGNEFVYYPDIAAVVCGTTNGTAMKVTLEDGVNEVLDVTFFLSSHGPNHQKQVDDSDLTNIRIYDPSDVVGGEKYDDIAEYVTLYQLAAVLCRNTGPAL